MNRRAQELQERARAFLIAVSAFCETLPRTDLVRQIVPQLIDAAGSASSNYNGACRARSRREFAAKIGVAAEEASEALEWLTTLRDAGLGNATSRDSLMHEADELTSIFIASHKTSSRRGT